MGEGKRCLSTADDMSGQVPYGGTHIHLSAASPAGQTVGGPHARPRSLPQRRHVCVDRSRGRSGAGLRGIPRPQGGSPRAAGADLRRSHGCHLRAADAQLPRRGRHERTLARRRTGGGCPRAVLGHVLGRSCPRHPGSRIRGWGPDRTGHERHPHGCHRGSRRMVHLPQRPRHHLPPIRPEGSCGRGPRRRRRRVRVGRRGRGRIRGSVRHRRDRPRTAAGPRQQHAVGPCPHRYRRRPHHCGRRRVGCCVCAWLAGADGRRGGRAWQCTEGRGIVRGRGRGGRSRALVGRVEQPGRVGGHRGGGRVRYRSSRPCPGRSPSC